MILKFEEYCKLNESNVNISYGYAINLLKKMGWTHKISHDVQHEFNKTIEKDGKPYTMQMTSHFHGDLKNVNPAFLRDIRKRLMFEYEATGDDTFINMVDWDKFGMKHPLSDKYAADAEEQEEINQANQQYKDAEIITVGDNSGVCIMKVSDNEYNICANTDDRRPLSDEWYNDIDYDEKGIRLGIIDWKDTGVGTYRYVTPDGIDYENEITESKKIF